MTQPVVIVGGPWPERIGKTAIILDKPHGEEGNVYPWPGLGKDEVIVLIINDPLDEKPQRWSCAIRRTWLQPLDDGLTALAGAALALMISLRFAEKGSNDSGPFWNTAELVKALRQFYRDMGHDGGDPNPA